jgi:hypothetical protein
VLPAVRYEHMLEEKGSHEDLSIDGIIILKPK